MAQSSGRRSLLNTINYPKGDSGYNGGGPLAAAVKTFPTPVEGQHIRIGS